MPHPLPALAAFGFLITAAALAYPGGTWQDPESTGFSFWSNFWCDLLSSRALNGGDNSLGAALARVAFVCFAFALLRFWPLASARAGMVEPSRVTKVGRFGAGCLLAVALVPASTSQLVHGVAVVVSAGSSLISVGLLLRGLARRGEWLGAALGIATSLVALLCLGQYIYQGCGGADDAPWLAGMQKVTTACLLALMTQLMVRRPDT